MPEVKISLKKAIIKDVQARVDFMSERIELQMTISAQQKRPIDQNDKSGMLRMQVIVAAENKEEFYISVTEDLEFCFEGEYEDFAEIMSNKCVPMAVDDMSRKIDTILETMGNPPIDIAGHWSGNMEKKPE